MSTENGDDVVSSDLCLNGCGRPKRHSYFPYCCSRCPNTHTEHCETEHATEARHQCRTETADE